MGRTVEGGRDVRYLFIDGGYLRSQLIKISAVYFGGKALFKHIAFEHILSHFRYHKCFYYDCLPGRNPNEKPDDYEMRCCEMQNEFDWLSEFRGVHVSTGVVVGEGKKQRQKQVDVQIAVDMLSHSHRRNMTYATLLAGDQDFKPLIRALVFDGIFVELWCAKKNTSKELILAADAKFDFDIRNLIGMLTHEFMSVNKLPDEKDGFQENRNIQPLKRGQTVTGKEVFLYENNTGTALEYELVVNLVGNRQRKFVFHDIAILETYYKECTEEFSWSNGT